MREVRKAAGGGGVRERRLNGTRCRLCTANCRGRLAGDPLFPGQPGALVVNCLWFFPLGFPRGEAVATKQRHFGTDVFVVTDEGWRWLKVSDFPVEWCNLKHLPSIQLHSLTNLSPPLISLFCQSVPKCRLPKNPASPRGKPRGGCGSWFH